LGGARAVGVLDEVRVPRRDLRTADAVALQPACFEHLPRAELVLPVLEDAAAGAPDRRLRGPVERLQPRDVGLDLLLGQRCKRELGARDDLAVPQLRVPIAEPELLVRPPARALTTAPRAAV